MTKEQKKEFKEDLKRKVNGVKEELSENTNRYNQPVSLNFLSASKKGLEDLRKYTRTTKRISLKQTSDSME